MIAPSSEKPSQSKLSPSIQEYKTNLPGFRILLSVAIMAASPAVAFYLLTGKLWSAGSIIVGVIISLTACGLLHIFAVKIMPFLVAGLHGGTSQNADKGAMLQFMALVAVKFLALGFLVFAFLTFHQVVLPAVLIGFLLAQTAIVVTVARHVNAR